ncbi:MAG: hypothetical protein ACI9CA_001192 [Natronomonas sp.]|jgi:hypothetical protein
MAGDTTDDGAALPCREGVTVDGNPTARELTVVLAAVDAVSSERPVTDGLGGPTDDGGSGREGGQRDTAAAGADTDPDALDTGPNSRERVAHERRCPVCRERYDSRRPLDGATSVRTTGRGASTVCVDPESRRVYVHSPPLR